MSTFDDNGPAHSDEPRSPEQVLDMSKADYVGTTMEDAKVALAVLEENVRPILVKLEEAADMGREGGSNSAWIKGQEAHLLLEWIVTILNHSQLLTVKLTAAEQVMGQMDAEVKRLNDGKGLWTPGGSVKG